jgi:hypothetical protein
LAALNLLLGAFVYLKPGFRDPVFDMKLRAMSAHFDRPGPPVRVAVLGSSRSAASVEPGALETTLEREIARPAAAYNMSLQGDGPVAQLVHFRRMRASGRLPDAVVVELLPSTFAWTDEGPYDAKVLRADRLTADEVDTVVRHGFPRKQTEKQWREATFNPWFGCRFQLLARVQRLWLPPGVVTYHPHAGKFGGWNPWDSIPQGLYAQHVSAIRKTYEPELKLVRFHGPHAEAFDELLRECKAAGVMVAVVVPPEGSEFRALYPQRVVDELDALIARLRREHGVHVVDTRTWLPDEAFVDTHHVHRNWAKHYTERLTREVIAPAIRGNGGTSTARR